MIEVAWAIRGGFLAIVSLILTWRPVTLQPQGNLHALNSTIQGNYFQSQYIAIQILALISNNQMRQYHSLNIILVLH
jgi:hypothetical protein